MRLNCDAIAIDKCTFGAASRQPQLIGAFTEDAGIGVAVKCNGRQCSRASIISQQCAGQCATALRQQPEVGISQRANGDPVAVRGVANLKEPVAVIGPPLIAEGGAGLCAAGVCTVIGGYCSQSNVQILAEGGAALVGNFVVMLRNC